MINLQLNNPSTLRISVILEIQHITQHFNLRHINAEHQHQRQHQCNIVAKRVTLRETEILVMCL